MSRHRAALALTLLVAGAGALWMLLPAERDSVGARPVTVQAAQSANFLPAVAATPSASSGVGHAQPPDPEALRNAPARQAAYDAEAKPGEFVTPPNVSIEH